MGIMPERGSFSFGSLRGRVLLAVAVSVSLVAVAAPLGSAAEATDAAHIIDEPDGIVVEDGVTQPVFSYEDAIREVVQVQSPVSSHDGDEPDIITVDIIRPAASDDELRVPTIMIPSPYYSGPGRGRQSERKPDPGATPSIVVGDGHHGGSLMTGSVPLTGQSGHLVDCGFAFEPGDCPDDTEGAIALIERDPDSAETGNLATAATASCSYTSPWESCAAINNGGEPSSSNSSPRWGTWPETGSHWIELTWDEPRQISTTDLYWFQDSVDGSNSGVKRPAQWSLEYWDGGQFVAVANPSGYGTALDEFNRTTFDPVTTTRLRANLETRADAQGVGAIEWRAYTQAPGEGPDQVANAEAAGAVGAVVYNSVEGPFTGSVSGEVSIPALAIPRADGLALLDAIAEGDIDGNLRELVNPIDFFPLYYDNVFVPRGYAVALVDLAGSRASTGCLDVGGPAEADGAAAVVEWLAGNGYAVDGTTGVEVTADWSNGKSAMIGKSWDGTIPIATAARAPEGLATIVPIAGLSHWVSDFWEEGARYGGSPTQWHDGNSNNPSMTGYCTETRAHLAANQENPDPNSAFWQERNWVKDVGDFEASVFIIHGKNDYNVKPVNFGRFWLALQEHDVPRKMWLSQVAHEKAFDFRRDEWLDTIHRWFDYWLHDIDNGITDEPLTDVEHGPGEWSTYADWPNGSSDTYLWFGTPEDPDDPRTGTLWHDRRGVGPEPTVSFREVRRNLNQLSANPFDDDDRRLMFLTPELQAPLHISGEPVVTIRGRINGENATLSAVLVDYGTAERVQHTVSGGILNSEPPTFTCFGEGTEADDGCYRDVSVRTHTADSEVVTRGWVNAAFQVGDAPLDPDRTYRLSWGLQHHDYVFEEGHRIGVVILGPETHLHSNRHPTTNNIIEVDLGQSRIQLPVVGGQQALRQAIRGHSG